MKIIYIAHPISGDAAGNLAKISNIVRQINLNFSNIVPLVPYFADCLAMDDDKEEERARGIQNDCAVISSGIIKEVWLFGEKFSNGMQAEALLADSCGIPVYAATKSIRFDIVGENIKSPGKFDFIKSHIEFDTRPLSAQFREDKDLNILEEILTSNQFKN